MQEPMSTGLIAAMTWPGHYLSFEIRNLPVKLRCANIVASGHPSLVLSWLQCSPPESAILKDCWKPHRYWPHTRSAIPRLPIMKAIPLEVLGCVPKVCWNNLWNSAASHKVRTITVDIVDIPLMEEILHQLMLQVGTVVYPITLQGFIHPYIPGGCLGFLNHQQ